tara:strand:- start:93 stop:302 length:210 start_codon:yes stop_codon:yes gene_type:complete
VHFVLKNALFFIFGDIMTTKTTKVQTAKNVFSALGLPWKKSYDGSNGGTVTAVAWRDLYEHLKKDDKNT